MASLAPHVSRTAKDYAPHGWSYVNEITVAVGPGGAIAADAEWGILKASDSDYYIEGAEVAFSAKGSSSGSNKYLLSLRYGDSDAGYSNDVAISASTVDSNVVAVDAFHSLDVKTTQLVPTGKVIYLLIDEQGSGSDISGIRVQLRYRRKA